MFGAIIGAATSLIGGALNRREARKQQENQGVNFQKLRDDALAAGFNPLTALQATGGAGYQRVFAPELTSGSFVAEAIQRGVDTYFNTPPAQDMQAQAIRGNDALASALRTAIDSRVPSQTFGFDLSRVEPFVPYRESYAPRLARGAVGAAIGMPNDRAPSDEAVTPPVRPITVWGGQAMPSGDFSDVAAVEDRYGEFLSLPYGLISAAHDLGKGARRFIDRRRGATYVEYPDSIKSWWRGFSYKPPPLPPSGQSRNSQWDTVRHAGPMARFQ